MRNMPIKQCSTTPNADTQPYRFERFPRTRREAFGYNCHVDLSPDESLIETIFGALAVFVVPAGIALCVWLAW